MNMENMNTKPSRIPIKNHTNASLEKTSMTHIPTGSTHGLKFSMTMSSEDKHDFLLKLEEWRKKKREKITEKNCLIKKENENQFKSEIILKNKQKTISSVAKKVVPNFQEKESVFERLYKNSKAVKNKGKENIEMNKEVLNKKVDNTMHKLKKKNGTLNEEEFQINHKPIDNGFVMSANNSELQSNIILEDVNAIVEDEYNINDNIVTITDNLPRATFVLTKETPVTDILSNQTNVNSENIISKVDEIKENNVSLDFLEEADKIIADNNSLFINNEEKGNIVSLNSLEKQNDNSFNKNDSSSIKDEKNDIETESPEENFNTLNKTFEGAPNSDTEILDMVSQQSKKSQIYSKTFSIKTQGKKNHKFSDLKKKINKLDGEKPQLCFRKSISSIYFQKCGIPQKSSIRNIASQKNQHTLKFSSAKKETDKVFQPIQNNLSNIKGIPFSTPLHKKNLNSSCLRSKLEDWLTLNNHPLEGYRHLRCFGFTDGSNSVSQTPVKTIKKNFTIKVTESEVSNKKEDDCNKENVLPSSVVEQEEVNLQEDENRLKELYQLIVDLKYDPDRCEDWLIAIRKKNPRVTDIPIYWECLAALNQDNEEIKSAVEQFEKALANKEEEKNSTDRSLAQLFDKLLIDQQKPVAHKLEKGIDPKNIFRSTIIKFSLQEKITKESNTKEGEENSTKCKYVATPVRRSSRLWTPNKNYVVNSLQGLSPQIRENVTFKTNDSLLN